MRTLFSVGRIFVSLGGMTCVAWACSSTPSTEPERITEPQLEPQNGGCHTLGQAEAACSAYYDGNPCMHCAYAYASGCWSWFPEGASPYQTACPDPPGGCTKGWCDGSGNCINSGVADPARNGATCQGPDGDACNLWTCSTSGDGVCTKTACYPFGSGSCCQNAAACNSAGGVHACFENPCTDCP